MNARPMRGRRGAVALATGAALLVGPPMAAWAATAGTTGTTGTAGTAGTGTSEAASSHAALNNGGDTARSGEHADAPAPRPLAGATQLVVTSLVPGAKDAAPVRKAAARQSHHGTGDTGDNGDRASLPELLYAAMTHGKERFDDAAKLLRHGIGSGFGPDAAEKN